MANRAEPGAIVNARSGPAIAADTQTRRPLRGRHDPARGPHAGVIAPNRRPGDADAAGLTGCFSGQKHRHRTPRSGVLIKAVVATRSPTISAVTRALTPTSA